MKLGRADQRLLGLSIVVTAVAGILRYVGAGNVLPFVAAAAALAFVAGGVKHGPQRFGADQGRMVSLLLVLAVAALMIPGLTSAMHTPAAGHETALSIIVSIIGLYIAIASAFRWG